VPLLVEPALPKGTLASAPQPRLSNGDLTLRPWEVGDSDTVRAAFADPDIQRWHLRRVDSAAETHAWITGWTTRWAQETAASWAVVTDGRPVGQVGLRSLSLFEGTADVSYWVLPASRGQGIAARALDTVMTWAFEDLGLHRLALRHSTQNEASCRIAEKTGFTTEGTLHSTARHLDDWHDMHLHARLRRAGSGEAGPGGAG
jgi:RimJ/RimL family protein N-acetyltransferase